MTDNTNLTAFSPVELAQAQELWSKCRTFLSTMLSESDMRNWIEKIEVRGYRNGDLYVYVPSEQFAMYLEEHYAQPFNTMMQLYLNGGQGMLYMDSPKAMPSQPTEAPNQAAEATVRSADYSSHLNEQLSFDSFLSSPCNQRARAIAEAVAMTPGQAPMNVLFIHGPSGVGKTHLSQAIGQRVLMLHPKKRVCYVSCAKFEAQYSQDARFREKSAFFDFYQQVDVLIIDDIQGLVGKQKTQAAFFEIFNHLYLLNKQIVLTCDVPPVEFQGIEERIITRIQSSMMLPLERPDLELRRKILKSRMQSMGIQLGEEVVDYIAHNMQSNVRELEGAMKTLYTYTVCSGTKIDIELVSNVIGQSINMNRLAPSWEDIARIVADEYNIDVDDLRSPSRAKKFAHPRQIVMYLCDKHTEQTQVVIAQKLRRKNHTTVIHGIKAVKNQLEQDATFRAAMEALEQKLFLRG